MNGLDVLQKRVSVARLQMPTPDSLQCESIIQAAVRAADHGNLTPWRFLFIKDQGLVKLGELFLAATKRKQSELSQAEEHRILNMPLRAPLIIIVIAKTQSHPKVPVQEQLFSAAAASQNILNAAYALGFGAIWRTGEMATDSYVIQQLGLTTEEYIIGFVYLGTPIQPLGEAKPKSITEFIKYWP